MGEELRDARSYLRSRLRPLVSGDTGRSGHAEVDPRLWELLLRTRVASPSTAPTLLSGPSALAASSGHRRTLAQCSELSRGLARETGGD